MSTSHTHTHTRNACMQNLTTPQMPTCKTVCWGGCVVAWRAAQRCAAQAWTDDCKGDDEDQALPCRLVPSSLTYAYTQTPTPSPMPTPTPCAHKHTHTHAHKHTFLARLLTFNTRKFPVMLPSLTRSWTEATPAPLLISVIVFSSVVENLYSTWYLSGSSP